MYRLIFGMATLILMQCAAWNMPPNVTLMQNVFLASSKLSPFNSQNTFISGKLLKDYFLFPHVGRMDDIWASYYVEAKGFKVVYGKASVFQARNVHDLVKDMKAEYMGYENNLKIVNELPADANAILKYLPEKSQLAFKLYQKHFA